MSTATRSRNRVQAEPEFKSKSDHMRALYRGGQTVAQVMTTLNVGYAFAYGVASRMPHPDGGTYADHAAKRRATKKVTIDRESGAVTVQTAIGPVTVQPDGTVTKPKGNRRVLAPQD